MSSVSSNGGVSAGTDPAYRGNLNPVHTRGSCNNKAKALSEVTLRGGSSEGALREKHCLDKSRPTGEGIFKDVARRCFEDTKETYVCVRARSRDKYDALVASYRRLGWENEALKRPLPNPRQASFARKMGGGLAFLLG